MKPDIVDIQTPEHSIFIARSIKKGEILNDNIVTFYRFNGNLFPSKEERKLAYDMIKKEIEKL
jgi:sialic acid synthase SpsE